MVFVIMVIIEEVIDVFIVSVLFKIFNDVEFNLFFFVLKLW